VSTLQRVIRHDYTSWRFWIDDGIAEDLRLDFPGHQGFFKAESVVREMLLRPVVLLPRENFGGQGSGTRHLPKRNRAATAGGGNANNLLHPLTNRARRLGH